MLDRLVEGGNTVVVIEHNLDVIKTADWIVDIGPDGGDGGGTLVAEGTPEQVAADARLAHRPLPGGRAAQARGAPTRLPLTLARPVTRATLAFARRRAGDLI